MMRYANGRLSRSVPNLPPMSDGAQRKSHQACAIEKALMPTYAWFIYRWCHWLRLLVPTLLRGNAYNDKIYTSMVLLASVTQAPAKCWIRAHCQRAPVTIGAKFNIEVNLWL
ncbi:hypothetical protein BZG79_13495 [Salinivibrio sp. MA427]|nr:hypothetical protein BZG79_13495 [Salinivibrio sp. MA427]